jgi:hypothetical protein
MREQCTRLVLTSAVSLFAWAPFLDGASAHIAMSTPASSAATSDAAECPPDRRLTVARLRELGAASTSAMPEEPVPYSGDPVWPGTRADTETAAAVALTVRQYIACLKADDWAAAYGLHADDTIRYLVTDPTREFMDVNPTTANDPFLKERYAWGGMDVGRIDVFQITMRPDGRIGAVIGIEERPRRARRGMLYVVLPGEHGRWRLVSPLSTLAFPFGESPTAIP